MPGVHQQFELADATQLRDNKMESRDLKPKNWALWITITLMFPSMWILRVIGILVFKSSESLLPEGSLLLFL
jgi:hypothetical protein